MNANLTISARELSALKHAAMRHFWEDVNFVAGNIERASDGRLLGYYGISSYLGNRPYASDVTGDMDTLIISL